MDISSMTVDLKFEPRLMVGIFKICTEALEGAADRIDQLLELNARLREQDLINGNERRALNTRLHDKKELIEKLERDLATLRQRSVLGSVDPVSSPRIFGETCRRVIPEPPDPQPADVPVKRI